MGDPQQTFKLMPHLCLSISVLVSYIAFRFVRILVGNFRIFNFRKMFYRQKQSKNKKKSEKDSLDYCSI